MPAFSGQVCARNDNDRNVWISSVCQCTPGLDAWRTNGALLLDEFAGLVAGPGVVVDEEVDAVASGRMVEEEEDADGVRIRIIEDGLAVLLEGMSGGLAGIGNEAASDFHTVEIGFGFLVAAESVADGFGGETEKS